MLDKLKIGSALLNDVEGGYVPQADNTSSSVVAHRIWKTGEPTISMLGVGCARAGSIRNYTPASEIKSMISMALDHGINVIDTANIYGQGDSERLIGQAVKHRQDDAFLITKIGFKFAGSSPLIAHLKPLLRAAAKYSNRFEKRLSQTRDAVISQDFSPHQLLSDLEGSLQRLDVEVIDGLMLHNPPISVIEDPYVVETLRSFKSAGKVKHFGVSVDTLDEAVRALHINGLELLQVDIDTARELATHPVSTLIREREIAIFARQVLRPPSLQPDQPSLDIHEALPRAFVISNVTSAIVGFSSRKHLQAAIDAVS
jgi:pyridoxine 4-dehydrogenase